ncbi:DUF1697 domain-containing protein [Chenggangzhangella methanolivorans]|uniref:DUF1697 domain-containing protein n=1 Tax=Chenggangzhangella methanolivorans TaxID=1437009 RepID=A0A9E6R5Q2_9HYPH|nr:DUF1697 domain-containing protein [Chenggangzhangella methanolivorans]QZN98363.1 DUF1697 domain-containing protein [Chenggangzhangella methanolivorans]
MPVFVALIRAINVGGAGRLPMAELRAACEAAGLQRVATYVASGNLVFETGLSEQEAKALLVELLRERFGLTQNHVILRTHGDLAEAIAQNPYPEAASARPNLLHVAFLEDEPRAGAADALAGWEGPERGRLDGRRAYLDYEGGAGRSKLTPAVLNKMFGCRHTSRNWNTVRKLAEMAAPSG